MKDDQEQCLAAGANDYIAKPLDVEQAAVAGARLDAEVSGQAARRHGPRHRAPAAARGDLPEVPLRLPRLRAGVAQAPARAGARALRLRAPSSQLQDRVLHEPAVFPELLDFLTVQVSEMFRDPAYFRALREQVVPLLRTYPSLKVWVAGCSTGEEVYSLAILLREEGLLDAHPHLRDRHQPARAAGGRGGRLRARPHPGFTENHRRSGARVFALRLLHRGLRPAVVRQVASGGTSSSPTTAWPPTASSPRCSSCPAATCSSTSTASCRTARSGSSATRSAARASSGSAPRSRCASPRTRTRFADLVRDERIYQKQDERVTAPFRRLRGAS